MGEESFFGPPPIHEQLVIFFSSFVQKKFVNSHSCLLTLPDDVDGGADAANSNSSSGSNDDDGDVLHIS